MNLKSNASERYFNIHTFLRYLYSSYSPYLHLPFALPSYFTNIFWPLASHHDSHTSRQFIRPLGLLALHTFFASIYPHTTSSALSYSSPILFSTCLEDILRVLLSYIAFTFTLLSALIPYSIPVLALSHSCFCNAFQDSHRRYLSPLFYRPNSLVAFRICLNLRLPEETLIHVMNSVCTAKLTLCFGPDFMYIKYFMYQNPNPIMPPIPLFLSFIHS